MSETIGHKMESEDKFEELMSWYGGGVSKGFQLDQQQWYSAGMKVRFVMVVLMVAAAMFVGSRVVVHFFTALLSRGNEQKQCERIKWLLPQKDFFVIYWTGARIPKYNNKF